MAAPPFQVKGAPSVILQRADPQEVFGSNPDPEPWVYMCYKRLAMGLGHSARIILAIDQHRIHLAIYCRARWLHILYPRPFLRIGATPRSLADSVRFFVFQLPPWYDRGTRSPRQRSQNSKAWQSKRVLVMPTSRWEIIHSLGVIGRLLGVGTSLTGCHR